MDSPRPTLPASGTALLVSEKFVSLQGEGVSTGIPSAFLRLGNCNLACSYCDTAYTWDPERYDLHQELHAESLLETAQWVETHAPGRLIITGGEPLIQQKQLSQLLDLVDKKIEARGGEKLFVEVETNGTILPTASLSSRVNQWNVSPKLSCSGEALEKRIVPKVIAHFTSHSQAYFKFVTVEEKDVQEVDELLSRFLMKRERILLMPEARSAEQLRDRALGVANWAQGRGFRYSGRLHLELYGGARGT